MIEHDPKGAVQLIDDLADGFRALSRMSGEKSVLLSQELELCRMHLRTLGTRMGITCALQTEGIDEKTSVPPAIFLTLIENGFAHQRVEDGPTIFSLQQTASAENRISFAFFSPGKIIDATERAKGGTGLRYVKARLEESFPDRWRFQHHAVDGGWETIIEFG